MSSLIPLFKEMKSRERALDGLKFQTHPFSVLAFDRFEAMIADVENQLQTVKGFAWPRQMLNYSIRKLDYCFWRLSRVKRTI